eukprot:5055065-Prymnesium_polylepis.1
MKDFVIPESLKIVVDEKGNSTGTLYPNDLVMMMGVLAKMVAGSTAAFWWCIGLPFLPHSSTPAD